MRINIYICLIAVIAIFSSCTKEAEYKAKKEYEVSNNKFRVKQIKGHNENWGDYTLKVNYENNKLIESYVVNAEQDTVGGIEAAYNDYNVDIYVADNVIKIHPDSVLNYHNDSIPMSFVTTYKVKAIVRKGLVEKESFTEYVPYTQEEIQEELNNTGKYLYYSKIDKVSEYIYEYIENTADVIKFRSIGDYEEKQPNGLNVLEYKGEYIVRSNYYEYGNTDWEPVRYIDFNYSGDKLVSVIGYENETKYFEKKFQYSGNETTVTTIEGEKETVVKYTIDSNGYVTKINYGDGNFEEIIYEEGHGNFSLLTSPSKRIMGEPFIK